MGKWLETELLRLGATVELREIGKQSLEGKVVDLPPVVLADYGKDPNKKTVLVYGHYGMFKGHLRHSAIGVFDYGPEIGQILMCGHAYRNLNTI